MNKKETSLTLSKQMKTIVLETKSGALIEIPLAYLVKFETNGTKTWSGKTYDLFS